MDKKEKQIIVKVCKKIRPTFTKMFGNNLIGGCWYLSEKIQKVLLHEYNILVELLEGYVKKTPKNNGGMHYWLEYKGNIIDVTATQFNLEKRYFPKIMIRPASKLKQYKCTGVV